MKPQKIKRWFLIIASALAIIIGVSAFMIVKNTIDVGPGIFMIVVLLGIILMSYLITRKYW